MANNRVLTIDITNESITVVEVTASASKQTLIHNALIFETPAGSYEDGFIRDKDRIASVIKDELSKNGITNKNVIFVLTSTKIVNREVVIPFVKDTKIRDIVNSNAAEYFPVNIEDYVVSHSVLENVADENGKSLRLLVVAAPLMMVKSYYDLALMAGLKVQALDYIGNSMLQLIKTQTSATMTTMVIQLSSESTVLNIVKGDTLLLQRTVPYGTNAVVAEVMEEKGVDAATALTMLQNERLITVDFDDNAATGAFRYLINNIGRVMDYYSSKNPDKPIDDYYLTGDGALIKGIDGLFKIQLNINVKIMDSLYNIKFDDKINTKIYNPVYLIAPIGAAFSPMNFIPSEYGSKSKGGSSVLIGAAVLAVCVVAGVGLAGFSIVSSSNATRKKDSLNTQISAISDIEVLYNDYTSSKVMAEDAVFLYNQTRSNNEYLLAFIDAVEKSQPQTIKVVNFTADENGVVLDCEADEKPDLAKMIATLRATDGIAAASIPGFSVVDTDGTEETYAFSITCEYIDNYLYKEDILSLDTYVESLDDYVETTEAE